MKTRVEQCKKEVNVDCIDELYELVKELLVKLQGQSRIAMHLNKRAEESQGKNEIKYEKLEAKKKNKAIKRRTYYKIQAAQKNNQAVMRRTNKRIKAEKRRTDRRIEESKRRA